MKYITVFVVPDPKPNTSTGEQVENTVPHTDPLPISDDANLEPKLTDVNLEPNLTDEAEQVIVDGQSSEPLKPDSSLKSPPLKTKFERQRSLAGVKSRQSISSAYEMYKHTPRQEKTQFKSRAPSRNSLTSRASKTSKDRNLSVSKVAGSQSTANGHTTSAKQNNISNVRNKKVLPASKMHSNPKESLGSDAKTSNNQLDEKDKLNNAASSKEIGQQSVKSTAGQPRPKNLLAKTKDVPKASKAKNDFSFPKDSSGSVKANTTNLVSKSQDSAVPNGLEKKAKTGVVKNLPEKREPNSIAFPEEKAVASDKHPPFKQLSPPKVAVKVNASGNVVKTKNMILSKEPVNPKTSSISKTSIAVNPTSSEKSEPHENSFIPTTSEKTGEQKAIVAPTQPLRSITDPKLQQRSNSKISGLSNSLADSKDDSISKPSTALKKPAHSKTFQAYKLPVAASLSW